ncbi:MAG: hypothetical protein QXR30_02870 [Candidatus Woesearchaeota archaeon]
MKKSSLLTVWILIGTILAALGLVLMMNLFSREKKAIEKSGDECFSELLSYANVQKMNEIKLKNCKVNDLEISMTYLDQIQLESPEEELISETKLDQNLVKINKVYANELISCYRKTGSGSVNLINKVNDLIDRKGKILCLICSKIKLSNDVKEYLKKKNVRELKDLYFVSYLNKIPSYIVMGSFLDELENLPTGKIKFYLEDNLNVKFDETEYISLITFSENYVIPQIIKYKEMNSICNWIINLELVS